MNIPVPSDRQQSSSSCNSKSSDSTFLTECVNTRQTKNRTSTVPQYFVARAYKEKRVKLYIFCISALQVATACFSCSPPHLNFLDPYFIFRYMNYNHCHRATAYFQLNIHYIIIIIKIKLSDLLKIDKFKIFEISSTSLKLHSRRK